MARRKVLIAGASGLVGYAAVKHFAARAGDQVVVVSRRPPPELHEAKFMPVDLLDAESCAAIAAELRDVTHIVYAAVHEKPDLLSGWLEQDHIETNASMLRNLMKPLLTRNRKLRHVTLLQGTKAYGAHVRRFPIPAREGRSEARDIPNFYWLQEDFIRERQHGRPWSWTILRPQVIFGESVGSAMNAIVAIGVYAALLRERGEPLRFPGGPPIVMEATDSGLLARAIDWAGESDAAANQIFNITNGDVFTWENLWPAIADVLGMEVGAPERVSLAQTVPRQAEAWDRIRRRHELRAPALAEFVGQSLHFADSNFGYQIKRGGHAPLVSTVKIRQAGFQDAMHTEEMVQGWFRHFQARRLLPAPGNA